MRGLLLYDEIGYKRNEWFISRLIDYARARGCELELIITDGKIPQIYGSVDFAIVRTIDPPLSEELEKRGIRVFNSSLVSLIANDKYKTFLFAKELGIPVLETALVDNPNDIAFPFPLVLKTVDGHGGSEVHLVETPVKCKELFSIYENRTLITQPLSSEPGIDMRVYVLGGEVLVAVKRTSECDFRSNFSLGGKAEIVELPDEVKEYIRVIVEALSPDLVGIDFIRHNGEWVLGEIEDIVGTRMLYALTDIDAADEYVGYVIGQISNA